VKLIICKTLGEISCCVWRAPFYGNISPEKEEGSYAYLIDSEE